MIKESTKTCSHCNSDFKESDTLKVEFRRNDGFRPEYPPSKNIMCYDCFIKVNNPHEKCQFNHGWCK